MRLLFIILLCLTSMSVGAQKITCDFRDVTLSDALRYIQKQARQYEIIFIYNDLEDFRVTTSVHNRTVADAILQVVGFYPVRVYGNGEHEIYVECTHKTDRHLTGTIIDEQGRPVAYANVTLLNPTDSTLLSGGVSNESGYFAVPYEAPPVGGVREGAVLARISYVGYKTIWLLCEKPQAGTIRMKSETYTIEGVTVKGQVPLLRYEAGNIIFDPRHIVGAINATDLLRYTPGVVIDDDHISLFGSGNVILRIDGREQRIGRKELMQILKSYAASDVESIEIVQSPGAIYAAEGGAGVINITLKKHGREYVGGSVGYALTQYEMHGDEANAGLVYNRGKVSTSLNLAGIRDKNRYVESSDISFTDIRRRGADDNRITRDNYSLRWQLDYSLSDKLTLGTYAMYADGERRLVTDGLYDFQPIMPYSHSGYNTQTDRLEDTRTWAVNVNATQTAGCARIDYNLDYYRMGMDDARHSVSNYTLTESDTTDFDYKNHIAQDVDNYSAKVDVSFAGLRLGSQYAYTRSHRDLDYSGVVSNNQVSTTYNEQIWAGYAEYHRSFGKAWSVNVGGRYEHTWTKAEDWPVTYGSHTDYGKLFPSFHLDYNARPSHSFNWSLSSHITRPNFINLNPNRVWKDVNHVSCGNQNLKPSYLYKAVMGYAYKGVLSLDLYYSWQKDRIDAVYLVYQTETYNSWNNITDEHLLGINSFCYFDRLHWMTATLVQGVKYSKTIRPRKANHLEIVVQPSHPREECVSYSGVLQASFFLDRDRKWTASLHATYSSPERDVARKLDARYGVDAGLQCRLWKDRLTAGLTCRNLLASHIKGTEYLAATAMDFDNKLNYRQLRLTLTYQWGTRLRHDQCRYESDEMQERIVNDF